MSRETRFSLTAKQDLYLHSEEGGELVIHGLTPGDLVLTAGPRYARLPLEIARDHHLLNSIGAGPVIEFIAANPGVGVAIIVFWAALSAGNIYYHYDKMMAEKKQSSYQFIQSELVNEIKRDKKNKKTIDDYLKAALEDDEELKKRYSRVFIDPQTKEICFEHIAIEPVKPKPKEKKSFIEKYLVNKFIYPLWQAIGLSAFSYWILWINAIMFTTIFGVGIAGMSPILGFGIPIAIGAIYPLLKIRNWFKNQYHIKPKNEVVSLEEEQTAMADAPKILKAALLIKKHENTRSALVALLKKENIKPKERTYDKDKYAAAITHDMAPLGQNPYAQATLKGFTTLISTYLLAQYGSWIITDLLQVAHIVGPLEIVNVFAGTLLMVPSFLYAAYTFYKTFQQTHEWQEKLNDLQVKQQTQHVEIQNELQLKLARVNALKNEIKSLTEQYQHLTGKTYPENLLSLPTNKPEAFPTQEANFNKPWTWQRVGSRLLTFVNSITTGVFIARVFFVSNSAIFLPFAAVTTLSVPLTYGIIIGAGLLYGALKLYEYNQNRKLHHAKVLYENRADVIKNAVKEMELTDLSIQLLEKRKSTLQQKTMLTTGYTDAPTPSPTRGLENSSTHMSAVLLTTKEPSKKTRQAKNTLFEFKSQSSSESEEESKLSPSLTP